MAHHCNPRGICLYMFLLGASRFVAQAKHISRQEKHLWHPGKQGSRVAGWLDTINVNNLSGKQNLKTKMNWKTIVLMRVDDSSSVLHFLSIKGKPQILLETNSIVLFLSSVYNRLKVACICPVVSSYSTMAYPVVLQVGSDSFPDKTIHLLSNF